MPHLPKLSKDIEKQYIQLVRDIDEAMETVVSALPDGLLKCRPGCSQCCVGFSVFALEAAFIADKLRLATVCNNETDAEECCPLLCNEKCPIYEYRPVLCRTQGLPIGYLADDTGMVEVSACPVNFADDFQFNEETVLFMDAFNARLATLNEIYCRLADLDPKRRIPLSDLIRIS